MKTRIPNILLVSAVFVAGVVVGYWANVAGPPAGDQHEARRGPSSSHHPTPWVGMNIADVAPRPEPPPDQQGVVIMHIVLDSPAEHSGLQRGDVILKVDGERVIHRGHFPRIMTRKAAGEPILLDVVRDGSAMQVQVTPRDWPG